MRFIQFSELIQLIQLSELRGRAVTGCSISLDGPPQGDLLGRLGSNLVPGLASRGLGSSIFHHFRSIF